MPVHACLCLCVATTEEDYRLSPPPPSPHLSQSWSSSQLVVPPDPLRSLGGSCGLFDHWTTQPDQVKEIYPREAPKPDPPHHPGPASPSRRPCERKESSPVILPTGHCLLSSFLTRFSHSTSSSTPTAYRNHAVMLRGFILH